MGWLRRLPRQAWYMIGGLVFVWCVAGSGLAGWAVGQSAARYQGKIELATAVARAMQLPDLGVLVTRLDRSGPAASSGVRRGDVIVAVNRSSVQDGQDLADRIKIFHPGDSVSLQIMRDDSQISLDITLAPFPGAKARPYMGIYYTSRPEAPGDL